VKTVPIHILYRTLSLLTYLKIGEFLAKFLHVERRALTSHISTGRMNCQAYERVEERF
jgi:hypothetical protein